MRPARRPLPPASPGIPSTVRGMLVIRLPVARRHSARPAHGGRGKATAGHASAARAKRSRRSAPARPRTPGRSSRFRDHRRRHFALARQRLEQGVRSRHGTRNARVCSAACLVCRECGYAWHQSRRASRTPAGSTTCAAAARCGPPTAAQSPMVRAEELDQLVWGEIRRLLCEPDLVRGEIDDGCASMYETDPAARRSETLALRTDAS